MDETMLDAHLDHSDEEYDENADEDFNPDKVTTEDNENSSSEDEGRPSATRRHAKRKLDNALEELDSGDEATIKGRERRRKKQKRAQDNAEEDESAEEEWKVRTRSQRLVERAEKKQRRRATAGNVTIDVDQIWADLSSIPVGRVTLPPPTQNMENMDVDDEVDKENAPERDQEDIYVTIKERVNYAGTIEEVDKQVLRSSKEAKEYFAAHPDTDPAHLPPVDSLQGLHRPLKRPSMFEPNPMGFVKGVPPEKLRPRAPNRLDVQMAEQRLAEKRGAVKMTTVQKSALDWRGFVDTGGFKDELEAYGRSNKGYLDREAFLGRAAATRELAARDARLKG